MLRQDKLNGAFINSLKRNNAQIREDRATAISDDTEVVYRRKVEDLELEIIQLERERNNMLDLSPDNADSLILAKNFNSKDYVEKDVKLSIRIRNTKIAHEIAAERYKELFGTEVKETK